MGKSPLSAVNDSVPRLEGLQVSRPLPHKSAEFNVKSSLSIRRHTRKYEPADGLDFRLCRVRASGRLFRSHSATIDRRALGWRSAGFASAQRRIMEADVLVVHPPVSREACGLRDNGAAKASGRVVSMPSANE
jgi:hypothetical protein